MGIAKSSVIVSAFVLMAVARPCFAQVMELDKDKRPQKREEPQSLPLAVQADAERLTFHVSPLSAKGLLTQQITDAVKYILKANGGGTVIKLRAFVASSGDLRRVQSVVTEMFSDRLRPLPALTVIQVGQVPLAGAQVVLESISLAKKPMNRNGLIFVAGDPLGGRADIAKSPAELVARSTGSIQRIVEDAHSGGTDVIALTCFTSSLDGYAEIRKTTTALFPQAAVNIVQAQRAPDMPMAQCEAVARLRTAPQKAIELVSDTSGGSVPRGARAVLVKAGRITMSSAQLAFQSEPADVRLAFTRLKGTLEQAGTAISNVFFANFYTLTRGMLDRTEAVRSEFFDPTRLPAGTGVPVEGLPAMDASFSMDVIASPAR